jgi:large subunit ribosomal protein L25
MKFEKISAEERAEFGKKGSNSLKRAGKIPCVIYGKGKETKHFSVTPKAVKKLIYTPDFKGAIIDLGGKEYKGIIKAIQAHPVSDEITHIDFVQLVPGEKIKAELPVRCKGVAPGIKEGGALVQKLRKIKVKALADNLVNELTVSISKLNLGYSVRVRDIKVPNGIEILSDMGTPIASIEVPRALKSAAAAADGAEGEEGAEATEEAAAPAAE